MQSSARTPRHHALRIIARALRHHDPVQLGPITLRWCKQGETFEEGDELLVARETGLYQRYAVYRSATTLAVQQPDRYTWLHVGPLDRLDELVGPLLDALPPDVHESSLVALVFRNAMRPASRPSLCLCPWSDFP